MLECAAFSWIVKSSRSDGRRFAPTGPTATVTEAYPNPPAQRSDAGPDPKAGARVNAQNGIGEASAQLPVGNGVQEEGGGGALRLDAAHSSGSTDAGIHAQYLAL